MSPTEQHAYAEFRAAVLESWRTWREYVVACELRDERAAEKMDAARTAAVNRVMQSTRVMEEVIRAAGC